MSVHTLTLRARGHNEDGDPRWHDRYAVTWAMRNLAHGKTTADISRWVSIPAKIERAGDKAGWGKRMREATVPGPDGRPIQDWVIAMPDLKIRLTDDQARTFWSEIVKLPVEKFFRGDKIDDTGMLIIMLRDMAQQLGEKCPFNDEEWEDNE